MNRLALAYLAIVVLTTLAMTLDPLGWIADRSDDRAVVDAAVPAAPDAVAAPAAAPPAPQDRPEAARAEATAAGLPVPPPEPQAVQHAAATAPPAPAADDLEAITAAALASLGASAAAPAAPAAPAGDDALAAMSRNVLAGLRPQAAPGAPAAPVTLQVLVAQALREGQTDAYIDALVNEAVGSGAVAAPAGLVTAGGRIDTAVLLASIVARAQAEELGEGDAADPTAPLPPVQRSAATGDVLHAVEPGDSLGALALRYYGDAGRYTAIFQANRRTLSSPDRIAVGQRLVIPALSGL